MSKSRDHRRVCSFAKLAMAGMTALLFLLTSHSSNGQEWNRDQIEKAIFERILFKFWPYDWSRSDRAFAVCIDWDEVTLREVPIYHPSWTGTAEGSDIPVFASGLMSDALRNCERRRAQAGTRCDCVRVASRNKSVLRVPDEVLQRLMEDQILIKCRLPDGIILDVSARKCKEVGGAPK